MKLGIAEILTLVNKAKSHQEKIALLQKYDNKVLRQILEYTFDPDIKWMVPEGDPPYKPNDLPDCEGILYHEWRRMYLFLDDPKSANLKPLKREQLFIDFLQALDKNDAKVILGMKAKQLPYKNIKLDVIKKAFPTLFLGEKGVQK